MNTKRALILFDSGLGDVLMMTPCFRKLDSMGYTVDLMCRESVLKSQLLNYCAHINLLITVPNPWETKDYHKQVDDNLDRLMALTDEYDWYAYRPHSQAPMNKVKANIHFLGLEDIEDLGLEVFPSVQSVEKAQEYTYKHYPDGFIFVHTFPEIHPEHNWDAGEWIKDNLPDMPKFDTKDDRWQDINVTFEIMRRAKHIVLSSSVFVHAADAMGLTIDVINYGKPDRKVWPLDQSRVLRIKENGQWIKK